jgi:glycosyltransferase involved in cell wall biosynthesis
MPDYWRIEPATMETLGEPGSTVQLTVVIPVHLTEIYLDECIRSVLSQPVDGLEVIAVDDASPDGSHRILSRFAEEDSRFRVISLAENVGLGPARNIGLEQARGTYVVFLDSDDFYLPGALARLLDLALEDRADLAAGAYQTYRETGEGPAFTGRPAGRPLPSVRKASIDDTIDLVNLTSSCQCLYRREFLESNRLSFRRRYYEDFDFVYSCVFAAESVSVFPDLLLRYYRKRLHWDGENLSITQVGFDRESVWLLLDNFKSVQATLRNSGRPASPEKRKAVAGELVGRYLKRFAGAVLPTAARELNGVDRERYYRELAELLDQSVDVVRTAADIESRTALVFELLVERRYAALDRLLASSQIDEATLAWLLLERPSSAVTALLLEIADGKVSRVPVKSIGNAAFSIIPRHIKSVLVHVGMQKTGSTFLQNAIEVNRHSLRKCGVLYPESGVFRRGGSRPYRTSGHQALVQAMISGNTRRVLEIREEIERTVDADRVILSSENLAAHFAPDRRTNLRRLLGMAEVTILLVLRRQDAWIESRYRESVTGGHERTAGTIDEYAYNLETESQLDYRVIVEAWAGVFGRENIRVRTLEEIGARPMDFVVEMLGLIGVSDIPDLVAPDERSANRFDGGADDLEVIRLFNGLPFYNPDHYWKFIDAYHAWRAETPRRPAPPLLLSPEKRRALLERYREGNAWIAREFLGRPAGDLFDMTVTEAPAETAAIPPEKLRHALSFYVNTGVAHTKPGAPNLVDGGWIDDVLGNAVKAESGNRPTSTPASAVAAGRLPVVLPVAKPAPEKAAASPTGSAASGLPGATTSPKRKASRPEPPGPSTNGADPSR